MVLLITDTISQTFFIDTHRWQWKFFHFAAFTVNHDKRISVVLKIVMPWPAIFNQATNLLIIHLHCRYTTAEIRIIQAAILKFVKLGRIRLRQL